MSDQPEKLMPFEAWLIRRRNEYPVPASFKQLERECGLAPVRLKQIEKEAMAKLARLLEET